MNGKFCALTLRFLVLSKFNNQPKTPNFLRCICPGQLLVVHLDECLPEKPENHIRHVGSQIWHAQSTPKPRLNLERSDSALRWSAGSFLKIQIEPLFPEAPYIYSYRFSLVEYICTLQKSKGSNVYYFQVFDMFNPYFWSSSLSCLPLILHTRISPKNKGTPKSLETTAIFETNDNTLSQVISTYASKSG